MQFLASGYAKKEAQYQFKWILNLDASKCSEVHYFGFRLVLCVFLFHFQLVWFCLVHRMSKRAYVWRITFNVTRKAYTKRVQLDFI